MKSFLTFLSEQDLQEQFIDLMLMEELSPSEMKKAKKWSEDHFPSSTINRQHDAVFGQGNDRITIPVASHTENNIHSHLNNNGYKVKDYHGNVATDKYNRDTTISKALAKTKAPDDLQKSYNVDKARQATESNQHITISRNPIDVAGMTSGRQWSNKSCMNLTHGCNRRYIKADLDHGTLVAYVHHKDDKNLENPEGRLLLKRHQAVNSTAPDIWHPESRTYGSLSTDAEHTIKNWSEKNYPKHEDTIYQKHTDLYNDDGKAVTSPKGSKFNPKAMEAVARATLSAAEDRHYHEMDKGGWGEGYDGHGEVEHALKQYRNSLPHEEQNKMDLHLHKHLAEHFHDYEKSHSDIRPNDYPSDPDVHLDSHLNHFTHNNIKFPSEHVDEIAKVHHDHWGDHFAQDTASDIRHTDLEDAILKHGSDETKAAYLDHHKLYGHDHYEESDFDPREHIIGPKTANSYLHQLKQDHENYGIHANTRQYPKVHANMAKHASDEDFHDWLHHPGILHNHDSYEAMAKVASPERLHKMTNDLHFDNGEQNGDPRQKAHGLQSAGVEHPIIHHLTSLKESVKMNVIKRALKMI